MSEIKSRAEARRARILEKVADRTALVKGEKVKFVISYF